MFRVVTDQLRISDGWVRCGRCSEVFDAREQLQPVPAHRGNVGTQDLPPTTFDADERVPAQPTQPAHLSPDADVPHAVLPLPSAPFSHPHLPPAPSFGRPAPLRWGEEGFGVPPSGIDRGPLVPPSSSSLSSSLPPSSLPPMISELPSTGKPVAVTAAPPSSSGVLPLASLRWELPDQVAVKQGQDRPTGMALQEDSAPDNHVSASLVAELAALAVPVALATPVLPTAAPALSVAKQAQVAPLDDGEMEEKLSFVRQARRKAFWNGRWMRLSLSLLALVLACTLLLQVAVQQRDQIAARDARLKPWLVRLCEPLGCAVGVPRQIESVLIEASTFTRTRQRSYRLGYTLRNTASQPVATPALEVTLTDAQDQPLLRRVLQPAELGATASLAPAADWSGAIFFSDDLAVNGRVAGYRLLAFYP